MKLFRNILVGLALLLGVAPALAASVGDQHPRVMLSGPYIPLGFCQLASPSSATGFSSCSGGLPAAATLVQICFVGNSVSYRDDGVAPTANVGMVTAPGCFPYAGSLSAIQFIQVGAGASVDASFYQ